jgi:hypothetical protein
MLHRTKADRASSLFDKSVIEHPFCRGRKPSEFNPNGNSIASCLSGSE